MDLGLGFLRPDWQPQIATATSPLITGGSLILTGSRFNGISQASSGNFQDSSTNYPVVQLRAIDNSQVAFLPVDPIIGWSDTSFTSTPVNNFPPGPALVTVFTNGIPSDSKYLVVATPTSTPTPTPTPTPTSTLTPTPTPALTPTPTATATATPTPTPTVTPTITPTPTPTTTPTPTVQVTVQTTPPGLSFPSTERLTVRHRRFPGCPVRPIPSPQHHRRAVAQAFGKCGVAGLGAERSRTLWPRPPTRPTPRHSGRYII